MTLKFQWEKLDRLLQDGLEEIASHNWEEVEVDKDAVSLSVDWDHLRAQERLGIYRVISAREGKTLAGYNAFFINRHTRAKHTVYALNDVVYLLPEYRKGWEGVRFLVHSDRLLSEAGVIKANYSIRLHVCSVSGRTTLGHVLKRLGYGMHEEVHTKVF